MNRFLCLFIIFLVIEGNITLAEGTKELAPNASDVALLHFWRAGILEFAAYDGAPENRMSIRIGDFNTEKVYFGFKEAVFDPLNAQPLYFRIKDPTGNIVFGPMAVPTSTGIGYIPNHAQAVAGPNVIDPAGYPAQSFVPTMNGDYYIEFNYGSPTVKDSTERYMEFFDITVVNAITNTPIQGRLCSKNWQINTNALTQPFNGSFYVYSTDSIVTKLNLNGLQPYKFNIYCNSFGVDSTSNIFDDRASIRPPSIIPIIKPEYCLFLNEPDPLQFPTGVPAEILSDSLKITGCAGAFFINVEFTKGGVAEILLNFNGVAGYQPNTEDILLGIRAKKGLNLFPWDGKDGLGNTVSFNVNLEIKTIIQSGYTNFPIFDPENNPNGFDIDLIRPVGSKPLLYWDDSKIGGNVETIGCTFNCHQWTIALGDSNMINTHWAGIQATKSYTIPLEGCQPTAIVDSIPPFPEDTNSITYPVWKNDTDPDDNLDSTTVAIITGSAVGATVSLDGKGGIIYFPPLNFNGKDSLMYEICDFTNLCDTAMIYICVTPEPDHPITDDEIDSTKTNTAVCIPILDGDTDIDGTIDSSTVIFIVPPLNGTITYDTLAKKATYLPNLDFIGIDSFHYTVNDNEGLVSDTGTVIILVNEPPFADNDTTVTKPNLPIDIAILEGDSDKGSIGNLLMPNSISIIKSPTKGNTSINFTTGIVTYIPNTMALGIDSFKYTISDNLGCVSNIATVIIFINVSPIANDDSFCIRYNMVLDTSLITNDTDTDGTIDSSSIIIVEFPKNGTVSPYSSLGKVRYQPHSNFTGIDSFFYTIKDELGCVSDTATVRIIVNAPPIVHDDSLCLAHNNVGIIPLLVNDLDSDGTLSVDSVIIRHFPLHGTLSISNEVTYIPNSHFIGIDHFTYQVIDDKGDTSTIATVTIKVDNTKPVATNDTLSTLVSCPISGNILSNDFDIDGSHLTLITTPTIPPSNGSVVIGNNGSFIYTPNAGFMGTDSFKYQICTPSICNESEICDTGLVLINMLGCAVTGNNAPLAIPDNATTNINTTVSIPILDNDTDSDGSIHIASTMISSYPNNGNVSINPTTGIATYIPTTDFVGIDSFTYLIRDNLNCFAKATVLIEVTFIPIVINSGAVCAGSNPVVLTASGQIGAIYTWYKLPNHVVVGTGAILELPAVTSNSGDYYAKGQINQVISEVSNVTTVQIDTVSVANAGSDVFICPNDTTAMLYGINPSIGTGNWYTDDQALFIQSPNSPFSLVSNILSDSAIIIFRVENGRCVTEDTMKVRKKMPLTPPQVEDIEVCLGDSIIFQATSIYPNAAFTWTGVNGFSSTTKNPIIDSANLNHIGTYALTMTVEGCTTDPVLVQLTVHPKSTPPILATNSPCDGEDLVLQTNPNGTQYQWQAPNGILTTTTLPILSIPSTEANYLGGSWQLRVLDANACWSDYSTAINTLITPKPNAPLIVSNLVEVCENETIALSVIPENGRTYHWTGPNNFMSDIPNPFINNAKKINEGAYNVVAIVNDCASDTTTLQVTINELPPLNIVQIDSCVGQSISLKATSTLDGFYSWYKDNAFLAQGINDTVFILPTAQKSDTGLYKVVIDIEGCVAADSMILHIYDRPITPTMIGDTVCQDETITLFTSANGSHYEWQQPDGTTFTTILNTTLIDSSSIHYQAGQWRVRIKNAAGCWSNYSSSVPILIKNRPASVTPTGTNVCEGDSIQLFAPFVPNATYHWFGTGITNSHSQNPVIPMATMANMGWYYVQIELEECFSSFDSVYIVVHQKPTATPSYTATCEGNDLTLMGNTLLNASYQWTLANGTIISNLPSPIYTLPSATINQNGNYTLNIIDTNNCVGSQSMLVTITPQPALPIVADSIIICEGEVLNLSAQSYPITANFNWFFNNSPAPINDSSILIIDPVDLGDAGNYTLQVMENGCLSDVSNPTVVVVDQKPIPPNPTVFYTDLNNCYGDTLMISCLGNPTHSYHWTGAGGFVSTQQVDTILNGSPNNNGNYTVNVTNGTCTIQASTTIDSIKPVLSPPVINGTTDTCEGNDVTLFTPTYLGTNATYNWLLPNGTTNNTTGNTLFIPTTTAADSGNYLVMVEIDGCVVTSTAFLLSIHPSPQPFTPTSNSPVCLPNDLVLNANISDPTVTNISWSNGSTGNTVTTTVDTSNGGIYTVEATTNQGCKATKNLSVIIYPQPIVPFVSDVAICEGDSLILMASTYGGTTVNYHWLFANNHGYTTLSPLLELSSIDVSYQGEAYLYVEVDGCLSPTDTFSVTVSPLPSLPVIANNATINNPLCEGSTLQLSTPSLSNATYVWTNPDNVVFSFVENPMINPVSMADTGKYSLVITLNGCISDTAYTEVYVESTPTTPMLQSVAACVGADAALFIPSPLAGVDYQWFDAGSGLWVSNGDSLLFTNLSHTDAKSYYMIPSYNNCIGDTSNIVSVAVDSLGTESAFAGLDFSVCDDTPQELEAIIGTSVTGKWTTINPTVTIINSTDPNAIVANLADGENYLIWSVSYKSCINYESDTVVLYKQLRPVAFDDIFSVTLRKDTTFSVIINDSLSTIDWDISIVTPPNFGTLENHQDGRFTYKPTRLEEKDVFQYKVWNTVCPLLEDDALVTLNMNGCLYPTAITPNGDGTNETLTFPCSVGKRSIKIFNRYGIVVHESDDYKNEWAATHNGRNLPDGTYYYIVEEDGWISPVIYFTIIRTRP